MKKVLLGIFTDGYPNNIAGGPNNIIFKILSSLNNNNLEIDYISSDIYQKNMSGARLIGLSKKLSLWKRFFKYLSSNSKFYRDIFSNDLYLPIHFHKRITYFKRKLRFIDKYDIIHSSDSIFLGLLNLKGKKIKTILTIHSKGPLSDELCEIGTNQIIKNYIKNKLKKLEVKGIANADLITFPSLAAQKYFEKSLKKILPRERVRIIHNGIDLDYINAIDNNPQLLEKYLIDKKKEIILLNIASHVPEKNISKLIEVVEILVNKFKVDVLFVNIGKKDDKNNYKNLVNKKGLNDNIKFLGELPNNDVIGLIKLCDVFLMLSEKVIFDLVVIEALACGANVVVSNQGGNKEIIQNGKNGYLVDQDNYYVVAKTILSIKEKQFYESAIKTSKNYSLERMVDQYLQLY